MALMLLTGCSQLGYYFLAGHLTTRELAGDPVMCSMSQFVKKYLCFMGCQDYFFGLLLVTAIIISGKGLVTHRQTESLGNIS